ncbi:MAG: SDR family oxidoreductase [Leptospirales bacterium]|nr:SDR family oxidoreductase [Leptospirales bacterium]
MSEKNEVALITGASSGIGLAIAQVLAEKKMDLILTARRRDRLESLAQELRQKHGIRVDVIENDLAKSGAAQVLFERVQSIRKDVTILVNNAGFGKQETVLNHSINDIRDMIQVNITSLTELTWLFGVEMRKAGHGRILQLASVGAFQPSPMYAIYSATKSYVLDFSYAMNSELKGSGVSVTSVCPGFTESEFHDVAGHKKTAFMKASTMTSRKVAEISVRAMMNRSPKVIPGFINKINSYLMEGMTRMFSTAIAGSLMKK